MAKSLINLLLQFSLSLNAVKALATLQPTQATVERIDLRANPEPTSKAVLVEEDSHLLGRSYYNTLCGYMGGDIGYPVTCGDGYVCATANSYNAAGCCNPYDLAMCDLPSTCIPYGDVCDEACFQNNAFYTSCGYLAPYCVTGVYEYGSPYYEYVCATISAVVTILTSAAGATQNVGTQVAEVTQTATVSAMAATSAGSGITVNCGSNSNCGNGNGNNGNGNGVGNNSAASMQTKVSGLYILSIVCATALALLW